MKLLMFCAWSFFGGGARLGHRPIFMFIFSFAGICRRPQALFVKLFDVSRGLCTFKETYQAEESAVPYDCNYGQCVRGVSKRIAVDEHEVRHGARRNCADLMVESEDPGCATAGCPQHLVTTQACRRERAELGMQSESWWQAIWLTAQYDC